MLSKDIPELHNCNICPHFCGVDRYKQRGFCGANEHLKVNLHQIHLGEEPVLSGSRGSGAIFFSNCNLKCVFCQNYQISCESWGEELSPDLLINMMHELYAKGAHNINLVSPSHYTFQLLEPLRALKAAKFPLPIVWNSNAYENVSTLEHLQDLVDIYLPDLKYAHSIYSKKYSFTSDYPSVARHAIKEMFKQAGNLQIDTDGIAQKGLIIRLLVLPNGIAGISDTLDWINYELGNSVYISLMSQYYPAFKAKQYPEISRGILPDEYDRILNKIERLGFENVFIQEPSCNSEWTPDFKSVKERI